MSRRQPNIVFIMADQLGAKFLHAYGSGVPSTPCLDRLAAEGVRFDRFYAASPVCAPNRATILTGRSPEIHGVVTNNLALPSDNPTYPHVLRRHGYRTGGFGKFHQTPMYTAVPLDLGFLGFDEAVISEDPKWGPWLDWVRHKHPAHYAAAVAVTNAHSGTRGARPAAEKRQGATDAQVALKQTAFPAILQPRMAASAWDRMYVSPLPPEAHDTTFITDSGLSFIQRMARNDPARPFFCHISYVDPHDPYDPPEPYAGMFAPDAMPDPLPAEWREQGPALLGRNRDNYLQFRTICDQPAAVKKLWSLYHGSLRFLDDQVARVVEALKTAGLWEDTILVFTTDHGDMLGDHGLIAKGVPHYDTAIRCPLIVAGGPVRPGVADRLSCSLDLYPTFCDWAGVPAGDRPPLEGHSLAAACGDGADSGGWREIAVACENVDTVVTDDGWRLTRYPEQDAGQMFHLREDAGEQRNLYGDPRWTGRKVELLERLVRARQRPRLIPPYRNLSVRDGWTWDGHGRRAAPYYPREPSPWLQDGPKPEWTGRDAMTRLDDPRNPPPSGG